MIFPPIWLVLMRLRTFVWTPVREQGLVDEHPLPAPTGEAKRVIVAPGEASARTTNAEPSNCTRNAASTNPAQPTTRPRASGTDRITCPPTELIPGASTAP